MHRLRHDVDVGLPRRQPYPLEFIGAIVPLGVGPSHLRQGGSAFVRVRPGVRRAFALRAEAARAAERWSEWTGRDRRPGAAPPRACLWLDRRESAFVPLRPLRSFPFPPPFPPG